MPIELKVPPVGESITEVVIGDWLKAEGDWVAEDEPIVVIESDKVNLEVPAPVSGFVTKILLQTEATATIGQILGHMEAGERPEGATTPVAPASNAQASASKPAASAPARVTPAARRLAAQSGVDPATVSPTGPGGRVLKEDVQRHTAKSTETAAPATPSVGMRQTETIRLSPMRKAVARHLLNAQQNMALLTTFNEIDMSAVMALRREHKEAFIKRHGIKLGFMSFFVKAAVDALRAYPAVNARIEGTNAIYHHYHDIGVAIGGGRGLVVPVIRNAERLGFADIEKTISDFGQRARNNKIKLEELLGGTFSITNGGIYGSLLSTPIVNPPQSGILGMHGIKERPIAVDGQVVIRPMMYVALTYDHRLVDGREAVSFLKRIKDAIESPVRLLLEV